VTCYYIVHWRSVPGWSIEFFSSLPSPDRVWGPSSFLSNGYRGLLPSFIHSFPFTVSLSLCLYSLTQPLFTAYSSNWIFVLRVAQCEQFFTFTSHVILHIIEMSRFMTVSTPGKERTRVYPKVSGLAARSQNWKWYSSLPLGAGVSLFRESV